MACKSFTLFVTSILLVCTLIQTIPTSLSALFVKGRGFVKQTGALGWSEEPGQ